jgi:HSP20 family molecular chaperone IbpA
VIEDAGGFTILADMPGATTDGIRLDCENRMLAIHATVRARSEGEGEQLVQEYGLGDFDREFVLPDTVDATRISAEYEHGVLRVWLPKTEASKPRRIAVRPAQA